MKKIFFFIIFSFFILLIFTKCNHEYEIDFYKAVYIETTNNKPIDSIQVGLLFPDGDTVISYTDTTGFVAFTRNFYLDQQYYVEIKDIDGDENLGEFETVTVELIEPDTTNVVLVKKE